jgi:hypothetical protein
MLRSFGATAGYVSCACALVLYYLRFGGTFFLCVQGRGLGYAETSLISYQTTWLHIPDGNEMGVCLPATRACETRNTYNIFVKVQEGPCQCVLWRG